MVYLEAQWTENPKDQGRYLIAAQFGQTIVRAAMV